jgi:molecular chaperone Hsp31 and glyoxalase 3
MKGLIIAAVLAVGVYYVTRPVAVSENVFNPSILATAVATHSKTDYDPKTTYPKANTDLKVLVIGCQVRDLRMKAGAASFSTGNHPTETLLPMLHLSAAGFDFDIVTPTGSPVVFEEWAMPTKDETVVAFRKKIQSSLDKPKKFADIENLDSYAAVFVPGGHGAISLLADQSTKEKLGSILDEAVKSNKKIISLCHGPVAFYASRALAEAKYEIMVFPDFFDKNVAPHIGYIPKGGLVFEVGKELSNVGFKVS